MPSSLFDMKLIAMVRKNSPFSRTFLLRLKELYSDPLFVRTILFPLHENAVYEVTDMDPVKPLLEVTRILQRVGPTNLRGVVANLHLILGQSDDTLVLPMSMPVRDLSLKLWRASVALSALSTSLTFQPRLQSVAWTALKKLRANSTSRR